MTKTMTDETTNNGCQHQSLNYLELYAGIGGWTMALKDALNEISTSNTSEAIDAPQLNYNARCVAAWDLSDLCQHVFVHNFDHDVYHNNGIEKLTADALVSYKANLWFLSPPCQPHTRQHDNQTNDLEDARSHSFAHICQLLFSLSDTLLPKCIVLENVEGFEQSNSCRKWRQALGNRQYYTAHFHLTPLQVEIPNQRPRYYCVALLDRDNTNGKTIYNNNNKQRDNDLFKKYFKAEDENHDINIHTAIPELNVVPLGQVAYDSLAMLRDFLDPSIIKNGKNYNDLRIPDKIRQKNAAWCFDFVTPNSRRTSCFTSSYGRWVKGTGSVLYTGPTHIAAKIEQGSVQDRRFDANWADNIDFDKDVRYFSGIELAKLFGFDNNFSFPPSVTTKQQWKLVGNSINVKIASKLIQLALKSQGS